MRPENAGLEQVREPAQKMKDKPRAFSPGKGVTRSRTGEQKEKEKERVMKVAHT